LSLLKLIAIVDVVLLSWNCAGSNQISKFEILLSSWIALCGLHSSHYCRIVQHDYSLEVGVLSSKDCVIYDY
jgi:hypothetical protein